MVEGILDVSGADRDLLKLPFLFDLFYAHLSVDLTTLAVKGRGP